jgi:PAS domain S-box-containing protein
VTATLGRYVLGFELGVNAPFALFFPAILVAALWGGFGAGILATILSMISVAYFFFEPVNSPWVSRTGDLVGLMLFVAVGTAASGLANLSRRNAARLQEFQRVVEGVEEMMVVVDRDYRYVIANRSFLTYRGLREEQLLGRTVAEITGKEVFETTIKEKLDECFAGKTVEYEMQYTYPSPGQRDLFISCFPIERRGVVDRVACILQDITERKQAQDALRKSEDRYRDLVEHSEELVCTHDLEGNLISVNPSPARILGYEIGELLKIPMREMIAPEFREQFDAYLARIKANGADKGMVSVLTRNGERRIWEYNNTLRTEGVESPIVRGIAHDITEQNFAQLALRTSEQRYRLLFENNVAGVAITSMEGRVIECNEAWARIFGYSSASECGKYPVTEYYFEASDRARVVNEFNRKGGFHNREMQLRRKDGTPLWVLTNSTVLSSNTNSTLLQATVVDITERKVAEEALRRREEDYRRFVAQSSEGIFREEVDVPIPINLPEDELIRRIIHDSYLAECNDAMGRMYGSASGQELVGKRLTETLNADDPCNVEMTREYIRSGFRVIEHESHERDVDGNPKVFRNSMIGIVENGCLVRTWGIQRDVTEQTKLEEGRKKAERALQASETHFRLLVEQASDGIFIADAQGNYIDVNSAGAEMLGYTREEILQRSIADIVVPENLSRLPSELCRFAGGATVLSEWKFRRKNGSIFPGEVCGKQLPDGRLQGILRDVSERRQAEDLMRRNEERFRVALKDSPITVFNQHQDLRYTWIYNPQLHWEHDAIGKTDEQLIGAKPAARLVELKRRVLKTGIALREEVAISNDRKSHAFDITIEPLFDEEGKVMGITGASMDIARLREMTDRLQDARDRLVQEKSYLENEIQTELGFEEIIGQSSSLREVLNNVRIVAPTDSTVLLLGETGTGKELVARSVHSLSARRKSTFVKLNCAAVPSGLLESELFGHEKGAFTGAVSQKLGRIELADKGTLFLDEIGELPLELQPKLLRVLQDREFERLGGVNTLHVDVRIVSATNRDLQQDIADRKFREDLYYRLNVFPIELPALRERRSDIPVLIHHFVKKHAGRMGKHINTVPDETMMVLENWSWPGNIRELENMFERMVILSKGSILAAPPMELERPEDVNEDNLTEMKREHLIRVLRETGGILSGTDGAASRLGIKRTTLQSMLKRHGIELQSYRRGNSAWGHDRSKANSNRQI